MTSTRSTSPAVGPPSRIWPQRLVLLQRSAGARRSALRLAKRSTVMMVCAKLGVAKGLGPLGGERDLRIDQ